MSTGTHCHLLRRRISQVTGALALYMPRTPGIGVRWVPAGLLEHLGSLDTVVSVRVELSAPEQHFVHLCLYLQHTKAEGGGNHGALPS